MHNPPSVSDFIINTYAPTQLEELHQAGIKISPTFYVDSEIAFKLEQVLGRSAQSWLNMQRNYDLAYKTNHSSK